MANQMPRLKTPKHKQRRTAKGTTLERSLKSTGCEQRGSGMALRRGWKVNPLK